MKKLREEINNIDEQLLSLLQQRAEVSKKVGSLKANTGGVVHVPHRENEILNRLNKLNHGIYPVEAIEKIWTEIFSCLTCCATPKSHCVPWSIWEFRTHGKSFLFWILFGNDSDYSAN